MKNIELKSTCSNLANLEKGDPTRVDIYSLEQILAANLSRESSANQVFSAILSRII